MDCIRVFQEKVFSYYREHGRDLPFRNTQDPYHILLSEIMLQQTQVERGVRYWEQFIVRWPTVHDLACAERKDLLSSWMGLGYNSRAIRLQEAAKIIDTEYNGDVLKALREGNKLPGIGPYTAAAVRIFAANEDLVAVDTNIRRIIIAEFGLSNEAVDREILELAWKCLPKGRAREWHNALMDYGATLMTSRKTGIRPKTRQSRFEGSTRQVRARILRELLVGPLAFEELERRINDGRMSSLLDSMVKEGLVREEGGRYYI